MIPWRPLPCFLLRKQAYWQLLLSEYRRLQTFNASLHPDAVPLERSILVPEVGFARAEGYCGLPWLLWADPAALDCNW